MGVSASAEAEHKDDSVSKADEPATKPQKQDKPQDGQTAGGGSIDADDEDDACGFCRYMKGGGCKDQFKAWSSCVDTERTEGRDFTEECRQTTLDLQGCMHEHSDYYKDILYEQAGEQSAEAVQDEILEHDHKAKPSGGEGESDDGSADGSEENPADPASESEGDNDSSAKKKDTSQQDIKVDKQQAGGKQEEQAKPEKQQENGQKKEDSSQQENKDSSRSSSSSGEDAKGTGGGTQGKSQDNVKGPERSAKNTTEGEPPSAVSNKVGGGAQGAKNPGGVEGTEEDSSQPSTGKEAGGQDSRLGPGSDASSGDGADQAADGGGDTSSEGGDSDGGDSGEEDEEEGPAHDIQVNTVPFDPRFPGVNQARTCYTRYNEFYKCKALKDEDDPECKMHQRAYRTLCPGDWVDKWNEQREEGTWYGRY